MGIAAKLKALWAARKVVNTVIENRTGWKTISFWVTTLGSVIALVTALKGLIPVTVGVIVMAALSGIYNILRGLKKKQDDGVKSPWASTEFLQGLGTELSAMLLALQQGGVNAPWVATALTILGAIMAVTRDLANKEPAKEAVGA